VVEVNSFAQFALEFIPRLDKAKTKNQIKFCPAFHINDRYRYGCLI